VKTVSPFSESFVVVLLRVPNTPRHDFGGDLGFSFGRVLIKRLLLGAEGGRLRDDWQLGDSSE